MRRVQDGSHTLLVGFQLETPWKCFGRIKKLAVVESNYHSRSQNPVP